jgi:hypothetical protein
MFESTEDILSVPTRVIFGATTFTPQAHLKVKNCMVVSSLAHETEKMHTFFQDN